MNNFRRLISFMLLSALLSFATAKPSKLEFKPKQHNAMHYIGIADPKGQGGFCTATAISPHVLLTAAHCDEKDGLLTVDNETTTQPIAERIFDKKEHMLLVVPGENFTDYIDYDPSTYKPPVQGEYVYMWGNPYGERDMYREGVIMGKAMASFEDLDIKEIAYSIQMLDFPGDSGAAIYGEDGRLVLVLTGGNGTVTVAFPLAFTPEQVSQAKHIK